VKKLPALILAKMNVCSRKSTSFLPHSHLIYWATTEWRYTGVRSGVMIRADEIRKGDGQIQFSLAVLDTTQLRPKTKIDASNSGRPRPSTGEGINLSGSQVLVGFMSALCGASLLFWTFLKLWLFE
jgi:hypothetical protein